MRKKGFTLIEMIIVIVIIGILAAAILPKILGARDRANDVKRIADLRNIATAVEMYYMDNGEYPKRTKKILEDGSWPYAGPVSGLEEPLQGYISEIPKDPVKGNNIKGLHPYCKNDKKTCKTLASFFEDGEYFYQILLLKGDYKERPILIAKVQTPSSANFVGRAYDNIALGCSLYQYWCTKNHFYSFPYLCLEVKKGSTVKYPSATDTKCVYTDESQLYYVYKIE